MLLAPSILAAELSDLRGALDLCAEGGADLVHVDVMDGHFVPNLTFGIPVLAALARASPLPMDVHLMVQNPDVLLSDYVDAGASRISVHWEATTHLDRTVEWLRGRGVRAGVALNPATPINVLDDVLPRLDFVLLMSVNPGFGGQDFIESTLEKIVAARHLIDESGLDVRLEVDGGIKVDNIGRIAQAGADTFVAGSAIFGNADYGATIAAMRSEIIAAGA